MKTIALISCLIMNFNVTAQTEGSMTPQILQEIITDLADEVKVENNVIQFSYKGVAMMLIYDTSADRMRMMAPIIETQNLQEGMLEKAMEANYHSALDARYAIFNEVVWSVFIHPLSDLKASFFKSAILQVATARETFGDQYTSGALLFGVGQEDVI